MSWGHRCGMLFFKQKVLSHQKSHGNGRDDRTKHDEIGKASAVHPSTRSIHGGDNDDDDVIWCRHRNFQEVTNCQLKWLNSLCALTFGTHCVGCTMRIWNYFVMKKHASCINDNDDNDSNNHFGVQIYTLIDDDDPCKQHFRFSSI